MTNTNGSKRSINSLSDLTPDTKNANKGTQRGRGLLEKSLRQYGAGRSVLSDKHGNLIAGNKTLEIAAQIDLPVRVVQTDGNELVVVQRTDLDIDSEAGRGLAIADNRTGEMGLEWDADVLLEMSDTVDMSEWFKPHELNDVFAKQYDKLSAGVLAGRFVAPPFSVLDCRQGYWIDRKKAWKNLIQDKGESRENAHKARGIFDSIAYGTSIFDPVLAEVILTWFGLPKCKVFDCFAGGIEFGYVSSYLGNSFTGIELRKEQAEFNSSRIASFAQSKYICDDGQNVNKHIQPNTQDLFFSCPPYYDLEKYSDLNNDASNQASYADFMQILDNAFTNAIKCLKDNRFAVVVVGDIRDEHQAYRGFVDDVKHIFNTQGMITYNEIIKLDSVGTAAFRASKSMKARKVVKTHQNVLAFYKGDPSIIKKQYPVIEYEKEDLQSNTVLQI